MAYKGLVTELPFGRAGMVAHENRLLSDPTQLFDAAGVTFEDDHLQRQRGAAVYDSGGIDSSVAVSYVLGGTCNTQGHLMEWLSAVAVPSRSYTYTSQQTTISGATTSHSFTFNVPAGGHLEGELVVVALAYADDDGASSTAAVDDTVSLPASWTHQYSLTPSVPGTTKENLHVFYKLLQNDDLANGEDIVVSVTGLDASDQDIPIVCAIVTFDVGTTASLTASVSGTASGTTGQTKSIGSNNVSAWPTLSIAAVRNDQDGGTLTPAGDFQVAGEVQNADTALNKCGVRIFYRVDLNAPTIVGLFDWSSTEVTTVGGVTITTETGSTTVLGTSTTFTDYAPGDQIMVGGEVQTIETITSDTVLDTIDPWLKTNVQATTYYRRPGRRLVTVTNGGNAFKEKPSTLTTGNLDATTLDATLSRTQGPTFFVAGGREAAAGDRKLFIFDGIDPPKFLSGDGTSLTGLTSTPPGSDWSASPSALEQPIAGTIHADRLCAWGNWTSPHRVYFSDPDFHDKFNTAGVTFNVPFRTDVGDRLYCGISFNGVLFVWKYPRGIFWLDDSDLDTSNWVIRTKSTALGCAPSPYAALAMDDDILFMAANGTFHLLSAVDALGGTKASDVTHALGLYKWIRDNVNLSRLDRTVSVWNQHRKTAVFFVPGTGQTVNTLALKFDFGLFATTGVVRFSWSDRDTVSAATIRQPLNGSGPETPIIADVLDVYTLDQDTFQKAGVNYTTVAQTPHVDLSWVHPSYRYLRKQYDHLELVMEPADCDGSATVEVYVDAVLRQTLTYDCTLRRQKKILHVGDGHTISVKVTKADANNMKLLSAIIYFNPTNEDQSR